MCFLLCQSGTPKKGALDVEHCPAHVRRSLRHDLAADRRMFGTYESISLGWCSRMLTDQERPFWTVPSALPVSGLWH